VLTEDEAAYEHVAANNLFNHLR